MKRLLAGVVLVVAALPALGGRLPNDPRGAARRDAVAPGSLAGLMRPAPEAGDPRVWYFVVLQGKDPDFEAMGARVEASWKNRRLVRVPPQAVQGLARHPDVQYLQRIDEPGTQGSRGAVAELSVGAESGSGQPSGHAELGTLTWTSGTYLYDGAGNTVSIGPDNYGHVQNYTYDGLGRLTAGTAHTRNEDHLESYGYDVYGNLIEKLTDGSGGPPLSVNPATNQLEAATYDVAGNMASYGSNEYFWDAGGMLKETWYGAVGQKGYVYTPDDERLGVVTTEGNYWTWTVRDVGGKVIREYESAGGEFQYAPWLWVEDYAHGLGRLLVSEREGAEGGRRHYHTDHLGSTRFVTTEDGVPGVTAGDGYRATEHVYFPFGLDATELRQEHGLGFRRETRLKYTGHERDYMAGEFAENTNYLDYMHARYYNPNLGRFLSIDPGKDWDPNQPQSWNAYAYVRNNPLKMVDPDGRSAVVAEIGGTLGIGALLCASSPACSQRIIWTAIGVGNLIRSLLTAPASAWDQPIAMIGENGTKGNGTVYPEDENEVRVDWENPAPGGRDGQVHIQIGGRGKNSEQWTIKPPDRNGNYPLAHEKGERLPSFVKDMLSKHDRFRKAIERAMQVIMKEKDFNLDKLIAK